MIGVLFNFIPNKTKPFTMSLITILIVILVVGGIAYLVKISPLDILWKNIAYAALALFVIIWLLVRLREAGIDLKI